MSPLLVVDELLAKFPSTYVLAVGHDHLRDEEFIYASCLKANGMIVIHRHFENTFHGSLTVFYKIRIKITLISKT